MEIGSLGGMQQGMGMRPMRPPHGDPAQHAEKMSAEIMKAQDADEDGLLSSEELDGSDVLAALDEDGDGFLSQMELQTGLQAKMEEGKAAFESGSEPSAENREFMQEMHSLAGHERGGLGKAAQAYGLMQEAMTGGDQTASPYNTDQLLLESLSVTV